VIRRKQDPHGFVVPLLICTVCAAVGSRASAERPVVGRTVEVAREAVPVSLGTATTSDWSVVAWVALRPNGSSRLKAAWIAWRASIAGRLMTLAADVDTEPDGTLAPQAVPRDDGSAWVVYAKGGAILARIVTPSGPLGDQPITLAAPDPYLLEFHAGAQPDGGLLLLWHHQGRDDGINHDSVRTFDSQGIPLAGENELFGGWVYAKLAVANEGGALKVAVEDFSEQGVPFQYLSGSLFDSDGASLRFVHLTPILGFVEGFDVIPAAAGGYWVTWRQGGGGLQLRARRVAPGGDPGPILIAGADPTATPLAPTPDDGFMICWAFHGRLLAQLHGPDARPRGRPILLARATDYWELQLAVGVTGRGVVAWWGLQAPHDSPALFLTRFTVSSRPTRDR